MTATDDGKIEYCRTRWERRYCKSCKTQIPNGPGETRIVPAYPGALELVKRWGLVCPKCGAFRVMS